MDGIYPGLLAYWAQDGDEFNLHKTDFGLCEGLIIKSIGNYRRTPKGCGRKEQQTTWETDTAKTPRFEATLETESKL